jgi:hypothetical protein
MDLKGLVGSIIARTLRTAKVSSQTKPLGAEHRAVDLTKRGEMSLGVSSASPI